MTINTAAISLMQQIQNPALTIFSKIIATVTEPIILIIISMALSIYLYIKGKKTKAIFLASTMIIAGILIKIIKELLKIPRPLTALIQETSYSLPSGHATLSIVFFCLTAYLLIDKRKRTTAMTIAIPISLVISFTRIYLQVHWLTDVIAGLILGTIILTTSIILHKKLS